METRHSEIRHDIERARDDLAEKTSELSHRAAEVAHKLRPSHQIEERPLTMLALAVAAGFAMEKIFFGQRERVIIVGDEKEQPRKRFRKRGRKRARRTLARDEAAHHEPGGAMRSVMAMGQMAATTLAREVATRLLHRAPEDRGDGQEARA